jgi:hypothetical protein
MIAATTGVRDNMRFTLNCLLLMGVALSSVATARSGSASEIFSETFDGGLGGWNVVRNHFSTSGGVLRGIGDGARGAMFRPATGVQELKFSFLRTENSTVQTAGGDHVEVGITPGQALTSFDTIAGASNAVTFQTNARQPSQGGDAIFQVFGNGGQTQLASWNIVSQLVDDTWYDGLIRLMPDNTATFGYKPSSASDFVYSTGHVLPVGFVSTHVGITAYRVPPVHGASGVTLLDNVAAFTIADPVPEPYLQYKFEGNAIDSVAGRNGTLIGGATFSSDASPAIGSTQSLALDGSLDKVIYDATAADSLTGSFTIALWVNAKERRSSSSLTFFGTRGPASTQGTDLKYFNESAVRGDIGTGSTFLAIHDSPFTWELNEWHHLAAVVTPTKYQLYIDGALYDTRAYSGVPLLLDAGHDLAVGAVAALLEPHGEDFHGLIDDFRIYARALSPHEIDELVPDAIPGDYNSNDIVDAADYVVWRTTLTNSVTPNSGADGNNNGVIDAGDYDVWKSHFGETAASSAIEAAVPEPSALALFVFAAAIGALRRSYRHVSAHFELHENGVRKTT